MADSKLKKGQKLICVPCGKEVTVSSAGVSQTTLWCCGSPMTGGKKMASKKVTVKKAVKKKAAKKPTSLKAKKK